MAGGSPGKGSLVAEVCYTCQEVLEEQRSSARLSDSYEMKVLLILQKTPLGQCLVPKNSNCLHDVNIFLSPISARLVGEGSGEEVKQGGEENLLQADVNLVLELRGVVVEQA